MITYSRKQALTLMGASCLAAATLWTPLGPRLGYGLQDLGTAAIRAGLWPDGALALHALTPISDDTSLQGWSLPRQSTLPQLGRYLGPFAQADGPIQFDPALPATARRAAISFDLHLFGSWDARHPRWGGAEGDSVIFGINGVPLWREMFQNWGQQTTHRHHAITIAGTTYGLTLVRLTQGQDYRARGTSFDQSWHVQIDAQGDAAPLHLQLRSSANDPKDEFFGLTNLRVYAALAPDQGA
jgi:hypothetical protein